MTVLDVSFFFQDLRKKISYLVLLISALPFYTYIPNMWFKFKLSIKVLLLLPKYAMMNRA